MKKKNYKISYVIPCYNSEATIKEVVSEIVNTVKTYDSFIYEIILVNDFSLDGTYNTIKNLAKKNNNIKGISLSMNFGQHSAIMTGLRYATGDYIVCLDDDGQTPADRSIDLVKKLIDGFDVVYAKYNVKHHSFFRNFGSRVNSWMAESFINKPKDLYISSYFACKRKIVETIVQYTNPYPYIQGLILRSTKSITNIEVEHRDRLSGESNYNLTKLVKLFANGFTAFSVKPLRAATYIGILVGLFGFIYLLCILIGRAIGVIQVLGYSSIMAVTLLLGGLTLVVLGIIGEYIGRIYICINKSPQAVVSEKINI